MDWTPVYADNKQQGDSSIFDVRPFHFSSIPDDRERITPNKW
jgi:hypothetical protein